MSYDAKDVSEQDGNPVNLYMFTRVAQTWRYARAPKAVTKGGHTWDPEVIESGKIAMTGDVPRDQIEIKLPISNEVAASFLGYAPDQITGVTVFRSNFDDADMLALWMGRVSTVTCEVATVTLTCEPVSVSTRRMGLHATYQRSCRHYLFGPGCNVDRESYASTFTVTAVNGANIVISGLVGSFQGGTLKAPDGNIFYITDQNLVSVTLMRQSMSLASSILAHPGGFTVTLYPGCNHSTAACRAYNNIGNFGGFVGIQRINPFSGGSSIF